MSDHRWVFICERGSHWLWQHGGASETILQESATTFRTLQECMEDARRSG